VSVLEHNHDTELFLNHYLAIYSTEWYYDFTTTDQYTLVIEEGLRRNLCEREYPVQKGSTGAMRPGAD
jgi:hypothetical protein